MSLSFCENSIETKCHKNEKITLSIIEGGLKFTCKLEQRNR